MKRIAVTLSACLMMAGCAGRAPTPIATVQPQDTMMDCAALTAEIAGNNARIQTLGEEKGLKVAQNVAAGVAGLVIPVLWFGMDFQGSADTEIMALQQRQSYLTTLATQRCARRVTK